ncbi:MAG: lipid A export permease/ATP-binding protein MsbA [Gammaproteobacteria bacterium]|nr:lipid A export permease/ATP-binding protein MsbA [Gammaproteobacteria bacterium]
MTKPDPDSSIILYRRLLSYVVPHWRIFILAILSMVAYAATDTAFAALMKPMLDGSFVEKDADTIKWVPVWLILIFLVRGLSGFVSNYGMAWVGRRVVTEIRAAMFKRMMLLPMRFFDEGNNGQLVSQFTYNVEQVAQATTNVITILIRDSMTILFLLGWMFYINTFLAMIFLFLGPVITILVRYVSKRFRRISKAIQTSMGEVTQITTEAIESQEVIKGFSGQSYEAGQFDKVNERNRQQRMKMVLTSSVSVASIQFISACALAGVIYLATLDAMLEQITPGGFISFITAMLLLLPPIKRLTTVTAGLQAGLAAAASVFALLDAEPEQDSGTQSLVRAKGLIEIQQLGFAYNEDKGEVLRDINLTIKAGETVALVGRSGSGKSTLAHLLPRFYDAGRGSICLDGLALNEYRLDDLRRQFSVVGQHVSLFNDTIMHNIAYGSLEQATESAVIDAAKNANAWSFIEALPDGLNTQVGNQGALLSGGQKQRIAIARALLKDAPILILDEATSALDTESERMIQEALDRLIKNRTTVIIAHRLSTIENADRIVVMDQGAIVETGKHHELLEKNGYYAALYRMQFASGDIDVQVSP